MKSNQMEKNDNVVKQKDWKKHAGKDRRREPNALLASRNVVGQLHFMCVVSFRFVYVCCICIVVHILLLEEA